MANSAPIFLLPVPSLSAATIVLIVVQSSDVMEEYYEREIRSMFDEYVKMG